MLDGEEARVEEHEPRQQPQRHQPVARRGLVQVQHLAGVKHLGGGRRKVKRGRKEDEGKVRRGLKGTGEGNGEGEEKGDNERGRERKGKGEGERGKERERVREREWWRGRETKRMMAGLF